MEWWYTSESPGLLASNSDFLDPTHTSQMRTDEGMIWAFPVLNSSLGNALVLHIRTTDLQGDTPEDQLKFR